MKRIIEGIVLDFPQIKDKKVKVEVKKLDLSKEIEVKLFS